MEMILLARGGDRTFKKTEENVLKLKNLINVDLRCVISFFIINIVILYGLYKSYILKCEIFRAI